jgi:hypothetical protein
MNLKEILNHLYIIESTLNTNGGEITAELDQAFEMTNTALADKVDAYAVMMDRCDSLELEYKQKADLFSRVSKGFAKVKQSMEDRIKLSSKQLGDDIRGNDWRFNVSDTKGKLVVHDESLIPISYFDKTEKYVLNNDRVRKALEAGVAIEGVEIVINKSLRRYTNRKELS